MKISNKTYKFIQDELVYARRCKKAFKGSLSIYMEGKEYVLERIIDAITKDNF